MASDGADRANWRLKQFVSAILALHISTRTIRSRRDEPLPDAAADEPEDGLEAMARKLMSES